MAIVIGSQELRSEICALLVRTGLDGISVLSGVAQLRASLNEGAVDLLVSTDEFEGEDLTPLMRDVRLGMLGRNPFPIAVFILADSEPRRVTRAVNSGVDDIWTLPFDKRIDDRLQSLTRGRRPFVVTQDYTGPDRRKQPRRGPSAPQIEVPHPLRACAAGQSPDLYKREVARCLAELDRLKVERYGVQIGWLAEAVGQLVGISAIDHRALSGHFDRLIDIGEDLVRRTAHWPDSPVPVLTERMLTLVRGGDMQAVAGVVAVGNRLAKEIGRIANQ